MEETLPIERREIKKSHPYQAAVVVKTDNGDVVSVIVSDTTEQNALRKGVRRGNALLRQFPQFSEFRVIVRAVHELVWKDGITIKKTLSLKERREAKRNHRQQRANLIRGPRELPSREIRLSPTAKEAADYLLITIPDLTEEGLWAIHTWAIQLTLEEIARDARDAGYWDCDRALNNSAKHGCITKTPPDSLRRWGNNWTDYQDGWKTRLEEERERRDAEK